MDFLSFDPEQPVEVKIDYQPPSSPLTPPEDDPVHQEVYDLYVKGYSPATIVDKIRVKRALKIQQVRDIIDLERASRSEWQKKFQPDALQDSLEYYQRMKTASEERALYADDKGAPEFLKIAMEAQKRIDTLLALGAEGNKGSGEATIEGLGIYRLKARIVKEDTEALPSGE